MSNKKLVAKIAELEVRLSTSQESEARLRTALEGFANYPGMADGGLGELLYQAAQSAKTILALSASPSLGSGWMDIASAPKDGTRVIGYDPLPHRGIAICHFERSGSKWYPSDEAWKFDGFFQPTHFMPLPPPPLSNLAGEG